MESKLKKNYKQGYALIPLSIFILDYWLVENGLMETVDQIVYQGLHGLLGESFQTGVIMITHLGSFIGIIGAICVVFIFSKKIALVVLVASFLQQALNRVVKSLVQRPRPEVVHLVHETSYSFPSGHAMAITCLYGLLIYYLLSSKLKYRKLLAGLCVVIIIAVCLSRVYLGVHYFSDVFGGAMLSLSLVIYICNIPSIHA